jgi:hypothetical protein
MAPMNKIIYLLLFGVQIVSAQTGRFCASTERHLAWFRQHPELEKEFFSQRAQNAEMLSARKMSSSSEYTIPVVFHILHSGSMGNISDAQVKDAVRILNRDFNGQNPDTVDLVPAFKGKASKVGIRFGLAQLDPSGNCTNGIIRHETSNSVFTGDQSEYQYSWPRDQYLNIYVVVALPPEMGAAAYTYLPGTGIPAEMDAIVCIQYYVGSIGTSNELKSRVLTHEMGHYLGLEHVWGWNQVGTYCGDDNIWDTPVTKGFSSCDTGHASVCYPPIVENVQNYMDYSYCCKMFTNGQADWMTYTLDNYFDRNNLSTSSNLYVTGLISIEDHCKTELDVFPSLYASACIGNTVSVSSHTSVAPAATFLWTADNSAIVLNPGSASTGVVITNTGLTTVNCVASNNAGTTSKSTLISGVPPKASFVSTHMESFEENNIPESWHAYGEKNDYWYIFTGASYEGYNSAYLKGEDLEPGEENFLVSPGYDLSNKADTFFSFRYAYARASGYHQDAFKVQGSKDCGTTWTDIYAPYCGQMASVSAGIKAEPFVPDYKHWRKVELGSMKGFKSLTGNSHVRFRFYFREDTSGQVPGNRLYLDAINFSTVSGIQKNSFDASFRIFPQPSTGETYLQFSATGESCSYAIESIDGKIITERQLGTPATGEQEVTLERCPSPGLYLLRLRVGNNTIVSKLLSE